MDKQTIIHTPIINATLYSVEQWMNEWLIRQIQLVYVATGSVMQANFDCMTFPVAMQDVNFVVFAQYIIKIWVLYAPLI